MDTEFVSEEIATLAKKAKFNNSVCAQTQTELAKWLRDKHNIHVTPELTSCDKNGKGVYLCKIFFPDKYGNTLTIDSNISHAYKSKPSDKFCKEIGTYEEALESGLKVALETLLNIMHYQDVEHKIGEIFKYDGKNIKVEKCDGRYDCADCIHSKTDGGCRLYDESEEFEDFEECTSEYRKDKEDVKFIEIIEE